LKDRKKVKGEDGDAEKASPFFFVTASVAELLESSSHYPSNFRSPKFVLTRLALKRVSICGSEK